MKPPSSRIVPGAEPCGLPGRMAEKFLDNASPILVIYTGRYIKYHDFERRYILKTFYRRLPKFEYMRPGTVDDALAFLSSRKGAAKLLAGGTDLIPQLKKREIGVPAYVVDLKAIPGLDRISHDESGLVIGPLAAISAAGMNSLIQEKFTALSQAALSMASPQVRNRGTIAGNICNAVPSADSAPALLALDASVKIKGPKGERIVPLDRFFTGPRATVLEEDEILLEIIVPDQDPLTRSVYVKLSPRHSMDLAVVGVAAAAVMDQGICKEVRIALGAVAPTPVRAPIAEALLRGNAITASLIDEAARNALTQCSPIDDHRASREYRCDMVYAMTRRALTQIFTR
jgi:CO/xanthine dehydrogenase FAD-binding subunit